jgi:circadian clock protein KaiC
MHFLAEGARRGERGLVLSFFESPDRLTGQACGVGIPIDRYLREGSVEITWSSPNEQLIDAIVQGLLARVKARDIRRLFIDGVDAIGRASVYPERVPLVLTALCDELRARNVTPLLAIEAPIIGMESNVPDPMSSMLDATILLRYVELRSHLYRFISVVKARGSAHDASIREFSIGADGIHIESTFESSEALLSGMARAPGDGGEPEGTAEGHGA